MWTPRQIERCRLETIVYIRRLTGRNGSIFAEIQQQVDAGAFGVFLHPSARYDIEKQAGRCIYCRTAAADGAPGAMCGPCRRMVNARRASAYQRRKAAGRCVESGCIAPAVDGGIYCAEHRAANRERLRRRRARRKGAA